MIVELELVLKINKSNQYGTYSENKQIKVTSKANIEVQICFSHKTVASLKSCTFPKFDYIISILDLGRVNFKANRNNDQSLRNLMVICNRQAAKKSTMTCRL